MALTPSNPIPKGTKAPNFSLLNVVKNTAESLIDLKGEKGTIVMFICNHCPFVVHVNGELIRLANDYMAKGINCIAISSNDIENYPQDSPELMKKLAEDLRYPFPYLYDETQAVAKAYDAACTPDFYLFDANLASVYHGQLDASRPGNTEPINGQDLRNAIELMLDGKEVEGIQKPSIGCNIKWK